jgi:glycerophosphoryl diester phosphodiesterase
VRQVIVFDLQGHRGARGLKPENTLPAFEAALDIGVTSIETDVHLTRDGVPVLIHDPQLGCVANRPMVSSVTFAEMRSYRVDQNPDVQRFPRQDASVTPLARWFAQQKQIDPYSPPSLYELFAFVEAYAGSAGAAAGKSAAQRTRAEQLRFDLELKRVPFYPALIGDDYSGETSALLEQRVVEIVRAAKVVQRTVVRSFDHRCVRFLRQMEPGFTGAVLTAYTAPVSIVRLVRAADAQVYCPSYEFLDAAQVRQAHAEGIRVLPWTVNDSDAWARLVDWGVDGITTDYPDQLAVWLRECGIEF